MSYDSCSCDCGDHPEFYRSELRKARKPHRCFECRCQIPTGERYEHVNGKWNGEVDTYKTCALCLELRQWAQISVPCFCFCFGSLHENIRDMVAEVRHDVPKGFVFEWGRRLIKIERRAFMHHWPRKWQRMRPRRSAAEIVAEARP